MSESESDSIASASNVAQKSSIWPKKRKLFVMKPKVIKKLASADVLLCGVFERRDIGFGVWKEELVAANSKSV